MDPVVLVGTGPAAEVVATALEAAEIPSERREAPEFDEATLGVVVDRVGADAFSRANEAARAAAVPWLAIELGGIGGYPVVEASVAGLEPDGPCYACLAGRVEANADPDTEPVPAPGTATARLAGAIAGRELASLIAPDRARTIDRDDGVLGRVIEVPHAERTLLARPGCDCGQVPDRTVRREGGSVALEAALDSGEAGLDDRVGIVAQVGEIESYPAPYYLAELCDTSGFSDVAAGRQAAGVATGWDGAFMKALGESYERYAAGVYRTDEFVSARPAELERCVPPDRFVQPRDGQECGRSGGEDPIDWYPATELATGLDTYLPASLVVHPPHATEVRPPITTGLGLGATGADALLSGLFETIERDATMLAWYSTYEPLGLAVDEEAYGTLERRVAAEGLSVTPLLVTQDVDVPVVAVAVHRDRFPKLALGSAAHLDTDRAARGALAEAVQNWMELDTMGEEAAREESGAIGRYAADPGPAREWLEPETTTPAGSVGPAEPPTGEAAVEAVLERLAAADLDAYAARTTTRDLERLGFEAVRVLVPSAQPLFLGESYFGERLESVPVELGFWPRPDRDPHPFP